MVNKIVLSFILFFTTNIVFASLVRIDFQGEIFSASGDGLVDMGDTVSGFVTYDTNLITSFVNFAPHPNRSQTEWYGAFSELYIEGNGHILQHITALNNPEYNFSIDVVNTFSGIGGQDSISFLASNPSLAQTLINFQFTSDNIIDSTALPSTFPDLSNLCIFGNLCANPSAIQALDGSTDGLNDPNFTAYMNYISVTHVPVPAATWLFATGLLGLFKIRKKV